MEATKRNEKIARQIINLLAEEKVSFNVAGQILNYVMNAINEKSTVQPQNKELFNTKDFKVRCVGSASRDFTPGNIYEVKDGKLIDNDGDLRPLNGPSRFKSVNEINNFYYYSDFELVEDKPKQFTKDMLKTGMRVKLRNGDTYIILQNVQTELYGLQDIFLAQQDGFYCGSYINHDLTCNRDSDLDIMEVYEKPSCYEILNETKFGKLIWTRHEPLYYTIAEAEAALTEVEGREVKIKTE